MQTYDDVACKVRDSHCPKISIVSGMDNIIVSNHFNRRHHVQCARASRRHYVMNRGESSRSDKPGVIKNFFDNVRQGLEKNKEMQVLGE